MNLFRRAGSWIHQHNDDVGRQLKLCLFFPLSRVNDDSQVDRGKNFSVFIQTRKLYISFPWIFKRFHVIWNCPEIPIHLGALHFTRDAALAILYLKVINSIHTHRGADVVFKLRTENYKIIVSYWGDKLKLYFSLHSHLTLETWEHGFYI